MVVPADWKEVRLGDISEVKTGPFGSALHASDYVSQGTPIITVEHLGEFRLEGENAPLVGKKDVNRLSSYVLRHGDLVFSRVGSIGRFGYVEESQNGWLFSGRLLRLRTRQGHPRFLYFQMCSSKFINQILEVAVGQTMPSLNTVIVGNLKISLPPLKEQEAIAEALSDADAAIESLDDLIAKKRDVKQAAMQQLLTGRTRLPGFTADWKEVRLGDIALVVMGQSPQSIYYNTREDGIPLIQGNADIIDRKSIRRIWTSVSPKVAEPGDVLITVRAPVGYAAIASEQVCLGRGVCAIQPHAADSRFVFHSLVYWEPKWKKLEQGSTFTAANSKEVNEFTIHVPPSTKEQEAIAEALTVMDDELGALTEQVSKLRMVKEGMMQDLLTGKVRLV